MRATLLSIAAIIAFAAPAHATAFSSFGFDFESAPYSNHVGSTLGSAAPGVWTDPAIGGTRSGLLLASAPGGGVAAAYNGPNGGVQVRSTYTFGGLAAGQSYDFQFSAYSTVNGGGADAFSQYETGPNGSGTGSWQFGIHDGAYSLQTFGAGGQSINVIASIATSTWYDFRVRYTVVPGATNDTVQAFWRLSGAQAWTSNVAWQATIANELADPSSQASSELWIRPVNDAGQAFIDNYSGTLVQAPEPATALLAAMGALGFLGTRRRKT